MVTPAPQEDIMAAVRRAVAYGRISEDDQDKREGVDEQLTRAENHIERRGWDHIGSFRDDDISAYSGKPRPDYDALMAEIVAGRADTIVVRHLDRLWRDDLEAAKGRAILRQHRVLISEYSGMEYPMWTAHGQHMARTMSGNGTFESDIKSERIREAAERRADQGRMNGVCPYGWRRQYERTASGRVLEAREVIGPEPAEVVREITRRLLAGESLLAVTRSLNERGIRPPGADFTFRHKARAIDNPDGARWSKSSVKKLALRESNAALRIFHKGEPDERLIKGNWPALVDESAWRRVVALLTAQERRVTRPANRQHMLTWGIGACGVCRGHLRMAHKTKARVPYYVCADPKCGGTGRRQDNVDTLVSETVIEWLSRADALAWLAPDGRDLAEATDRAAGARDLLAVAGVKLAAGEWMIETVDAVTATARPKLEQAEADIRRLTAASSSRVLADIAGGQARARWEALTVTGRRAVLEAIGLRVTLLPVGRRGPGFDPDTVKIERKQPPSGPVDVVTTV
jgi:DNA invertase Pin-like site-specific DNA recombinase